MQIHGPSGSFSKIPVRLNSGGFTVLSFGTADVFAHTAADCDELIKAGVLAKSMLLGETSEPVTADLPAAERPDNRPQRPDCGAHDSDYVCTAARGHTGYHMAYNGRVRDGAPSPSLCHSWPQETAQDDAGRAIAADLDERGGSPSCQAARLGSGDCEHGHGHAGRAIAADLDEQHGGES
jgi:hypothetical protein